MISGLFNFIAIAVGALAIAAGLIAFAAREEKRHEANLGRLLASDPVTSLDDRKHLNAVLNAEWQRARRKGSNLSLLIVDVDHFKRLTHMLGHEACDEILRGIAGRIRESVRRPVDTIARFAPDQFAIVLRNASADSAKVMAHMIRKQVECMEVWHSEGEYNRLTVSVGCATCIPVRGMGASALLAAADEQMSAAKSAGRNRVRAAVLSTKTGVGRDG